MYRPQYKTYSIFSTKKIAMRFKDNLKANFKELVRLHINLLGFFSTSSMGRIVYSFLLLFYFTRVFNDVATFIITCIIFYLFITGCLLLLLMKIPRTREIMFQIYGKDYLYKRLGNPLGNLKSFVNATASIFIMDELAKAWQGYINRGTAATFEKDVRNIWKEQGNLTPNREELEELRREITARKEAPRPGVGGAIMDVLNIPNPNVPTFPPANPELKNLFSVEPENKKIN